jgi:hypothetical protein
LYALYHLTWDQIEVMPKGEVDELLGQFGKVHASMSALMTGAR